MTEDKVESRTQAEQLRQKIYDRWKKARQDFGQASWQKFVLEDIEETLAARPSVPEQGQTLACIHGKLLSEDCRGCGYGKLINNERIVAASRSEAQPPQELPDVLRMDAAGRPVCELLHEAAQYMNQNGGGPLADCLTLKAQEIESLSAGAPAAGSAERTKNG